MALGQETLYFPVRATVPVIVPPAWTTCGETDSAPRRVATRQFPNS